MECREARELVLLLCYGELLGPDRGPVERHLEGCFACRLALAQERRLLALLSQRPPADPPADLLERCRADLSAALRAGVLEPRAGAWVRFWERARLRPAFAGLLLVAGFLGGGLAVGGGLVPVPFRGVQAPRLARAPGDDASSGLSSLSVDPRTDRVSLSYDERRRTQVEGRAADPEIRRLLVETVRHSYNAGLRLDALDALRRHAGDRDVRAALLQALGGDDNAGARLKAIEALQERAGADAEVRGAMLGALLHDRNPGVRVRAVDALAASRGPEILPVMQRLAREDQDSYVRLRSSAYVDEMVAKERR